VCDECGNNFATKQVCILFILRQKFEKRKEVEKYKEGKKMESKEVPKIVANLTKMAKYGPVA
jgi:hypothetical protein